jgi:hypothetical protein
MHVHHCLRSTLPRRGQEQDDGILPITMSRQTENQGGCGLWLVWSTLLLSRECVVLAWSSLHTFSNTQLCNTIQWLFVLNSISSTFYRTLVYSLESTGGLVLYLHRKDRLQSERQSHTGERERRCGFIIWRIIDRQ